MVPPWEDDPVSVPVGLHWLKLQVNLVSATDSNATTSGGHSTINKTHLASLAATQVQFTTKRQPQGVKCAVPVDSAVPSQDQCEALRRSKIFCYSHVKLKQLEEEVGA